MSSRIPRQLYVCMAVYTYSRTNVGAAVSVFATQSMLICLSFIFYFPQIFLKSVTISWDQKALLHFLRTAKLNKLRMISSLTLTAWLCSQTYTLSAAAYMGLFCCVYCGVEHASKS